MLLIQVLVVYLLSQNYTPQALGMYMLFVAISVPVVNFLLMDASSKILAGIVKTRNILEVLGLILAVAFFLLLGIICYQLIEFNFIPDWVIPLPAIFYLKAGQAVIELEIAELKREERFKELFWLIIKSQFLVYVIITLMMFKKIDLLFVYAASAFASCFMAATGLRRMMQNGWIVGFRSPIVYIKSELHLGFAIGIKYLSGNLLRYVAVGAYGITTFGYMAPAFYSLTVFSNLGAVIENVLTPRVLKRIDIGEISFSAFKVELALVSVVSLLIMIGSYFTANFVYGFFYPEQADDYSALITIFSLGYFFYVLRSVMKVISFKFGLEKWQIGVQLLFMAILILSLLISSDFFGIYALGFAYVMASILICLFYLIITWQFLQRKPR